MHKPWWLGTILSIAILVSGQSIAQNEISSEQAQELAADRFNQLFTELYFKNPVDKDLYPLGTMTATDFVVVEQNSSGFLLSHAPPAGLEVQVRVSVDGNWVEILSVIFASE